MALQSSLRLTSCLRCGRQTNTARWERKFWSALLQNPNISCANGFSAHNLRDRVLSIRKKSAATKSQRRNWAATNTNTTLAWLSSLLAWKITCASTSAIWVNKRLNCHWHGGRFSPTWPVCWSSATIMRLQRPCKLSWTEIGRFLMKCNCFERSSWRIWRTTLGKAMRSQCLLMSWRKFWSSGFSMRIWLEISIRSSTSMIGMGLKTRICRMSR